MSELPTEQPRPDPPSPPAAPPRASKPAWLFTFLCIGFGSIVGASAGDSQDPASVSRTVSEAVHDSIVWGIGGGILGLILGGVLARSGTGIKGRLTSAGAGFLAIGIGGMIGVLIVNLFIGLIRWETESTDWRRGGVIGAITAIVIVWALNWIAVWRSRDSARSPSAKVT